MAHLPSPDRQIKPDGNRRHRRKPGGNQRPDRIPRTCMRSRWCILPLLALCVLIMATAFVAYPGLVSTGLQKPLSQSYPPRYVSYAGRRAVPYKKRGAVGLKTDDSVAPPAVEMADADKGMSSSSTVSRISSWIWSALFGDSGINQNEDAPEPIDTARLNAKGKSV
eukprot:COSAG01_NODE_37912_length_497_cov_0.809045_1_plen_165_part_11